MTIPADLNYTADHEWVRLDGDIATVGITSFAADALGDVVYVDLPETGTTITVGEPCGEVESTKSVSDLIAPISGEVTETNAEVALDPALVGTDPFTRGWLYRVRVTGAPRDLLDADAYAALVENA